eukprot:2868890-Prorocentrum_lima.AAC.1
MLQPHLARLLRQDAGEHLVVAGVDLVPLREVLHAVQAPAYRQEPAVRPIVVLLVVRGSQ